MFEGAEVVDGMKAQQSAAEKQRREGLVRRLNDFLTAESVGESGESAEAARKALEAGSTQEAIAYLSTEIDKAEREKTGTTDPDVLQTLELRRGGLMRWKVSLTQR